MITHHHNVIREIALKKLASQKQRNRIACLAIMLTTFMIYTLCSIGLSFWESMRLQEIYAAGVDADLLLAEFTPRQQEVLEDRGLCERIGYITRVATLGNTKELGVNGAGFYYADGACLEDQIAPAMLSMEGSFPVREREILVPDWFASKLGVLPGQLGTQVELVIYYGGVDGDFNRLSENETAAFTVCGIYEDNSVNYIHNTAYIYVSRDFWEAAPFEDEQYKSAAYLTLKQGIGRGELLRELDLAKGQELTPFKQQYAENDDGVLEVGLGVLLVIVCGSLIIYNILSLSAAQDIRFFGQLKTLGVTKRQLKSYMRYQIWWLCLLGVPGGLALAVPLSAFVVPQAVYALRTVDQVQVSFSPLLFVGTALLSVFTVVIGSLRPLRMAAGVSPIAAAQYVNVSVRKKECKRKRDSMLSIAWRNVFRSRKSAFVVFLSLFLAVMLFFTLDGLLSGYSASALVGNSMYYDIVVEGVNGSFSEQTLREVAAIPGVASMEEMRMLKPQSSEADWLKVSEPKLQMYCDKVRADLSEINIAAVESAIQGDLYKMSMIGIGQQEFARISEACGMEADKEAFQSGAVGIWLCNTFEDDEQLLMPQDAQTVYLGGLKGQKVTIPRMERVACTSSMLLLMQEVAPNILVSNDTLCAIADTFVFRLNIQLEQPQADAQVQTALKGILGDSPMISIDSKQDKVEKNESSFSTIRTLASVMSLILFFIGIMNFINTMYAGILARQKELEMLECIGMSKKQVKQMLIAEGMLYMLVTAGLVLTLGAAIYLQAYAAFTKLADWAQLRYPLRAAGITGTVMLIMAVAVPLMAYRSIFSKDRPQPNGE
ncbi:MAG: ABC transporter permease [Eubacterium sp.]|nr:ABC transporter permease [Eubacterium sp.]